MLTAVPGGPGEICAKAASFPGTQRLLPEAMKREMHGAVMVSDSGSWDEIQEVNCHLL